MESQLQHVREIASTSSSSTSFSDEDVGIPQQPVTTAPPEVNVENSTDVQVGPRYNYAAPVTINQYVQVTSGQTAAISHDQLLRTALEPPLHDQDLVTDSHEGEASTTSTNSSEITINKGTSQNPRSVSPEPVTPKQYKPAEKYCVLQLLWSLFVIFLLISVCLGTTVGVHWKYTTPFRESPSFQFTTEASLTTEECTSCESTVLPGGHKFYSRHEWGAVDGVIAEPLRHPTPIAVISHTKQHMCNSFESCIPALQQMNISWNFLVSTDGSVYEGRGWDKQSELQVPEVSLAISLIGDYNKMNLQFMQEDAVHQLLAAGVKMGKLLPNYKIVFQGQIDGTSPSLTTGKKTIAAISKWPHYDPNFGVPI